MNTPYSTPQSTLPLDEPALSQRPAQPLWKAFWLVFVPTCLGANILSVMGLLFWKTQVLQKTVMPVSPSSLPWLLWLTLAVPFLIATPLGLLAIWRAAPARRFTVLTQMAKLVALAYFAYVAYMLTKGFLRVI
ncbi:hypothetical protein [Pseudomonas turukhanskensis]|uniref:Uncharacterized protein n=1 Tax=Pseudomonas turukhanskensis TaxID=1806536 RepID=A0A9W6K4F4_9PSED|nr:hypothetical protein [Pseudomonas turukhanskensis]GLK88056.1 hypothetical protein GCM10017655_11180 [Pseudomonas turukhanskensis]